MDDHSFRLGDHGRYVAQSKEGNIMRCHLAIFLVLALCSAASGQTLKQSIVTESDVVVKRKERIEKKNVVQLPVHNFSSMIPPKIAELVKKSTEIEAGKIRVGCMVEDEDSAFGDAIIGGDGFARKGEIKIGKLHSKHDYSYKFKRIFEFSNGSSFVAEGAFEFKNNLISKKCYLICRMSGARDSKGLVTGKCQWIGPIELNNVTTTTMALPAMFEADPGNK